MITMKAKQILTIAHRGLCNVFPECTLASIQAGLHVADFVQFDVHLTKDDNLVVYHDKGLSRLTNVSEFQQFAQRKYIADYEMPNQFAQDWWLKDFTLQQLKKLKVKQAYQNRPQYLNQGLTFRIPTFQQVLQLGLNVKSMEHMSKSSAGFSIQIKTQSYDKYSERDKILVQKIVYCLKKYGLVDQVNCSVRNLPVLIGSFCQRTLENFNSLLNLPIINLLYKEVVTIQLLQALKLKNSRYIGVTNWHFQQEKLAEMCEQINLQILYWTVIDDEQGSKLPFGVDNYVDYYRKLKQLKVSGIITEFPEKCKAIIS